MNEFEIHTQLHKSTRTGSNRTRFFFIFSQTAKRLTLPSKKVIEIVQFEIRIEQMNAKNSIIFNWSVIILFISFRLWKWEHCLCVYFTLKGPIESNQIKSKRALTI